MGYLSIRQISEKWGLSIRRINELCTENRIPGATKIGSYWVIPEDAKKPKDARVKSEKWKIHKAYNKKRGRINGSH